MHPLKSVFGYILVAFSLALYPAFAQADAPVIAGNACPQLGQSQLGDDRSSLVICLQISSTDTRLVWKSMISQVGVPVGAIIAWPVTADPPDMNLWLDCDGSAITKDDYPVLFGVVGSRLPDLRGLFLRGVGGNSLSLGSVQADAFKSHTHPLYVYPGSGINNGGANIVNGSGAGVLPTSGVTTSTGDIETRPANMAVRYLIRARN